MYGASKQKIILNTLKALASSQNIESSYLVRYDYSEIRRFLEAFKWNSEVSKRMILEDILWRESVMQQMHLKMFLKLIKSD
jgi:hypothetical protein